MLTVDDKPAFSPLNNPAIVATFRGARRLLLVTGFRPPVLTMTALDGALPSAITLQSYPVGEAFLP